MKNNNVEEKVSVARDKGRRIAKCVADSLLGGGNFTHGPEFGIVYRRAIENSVEVTCGLALLEEEITLTGKIRFLDGSVIKRDLPTLFEMHRMLNHALTCSGLKGDELKEYKAVMEYLRELVDLHAVNR